MMPCALRELEPDPLGLEERRLAPDAVIVARHRAQP